jgi:hypothetical protein
MPKLILFDEPVDLQVRNKNYVKTLLSMQKGINAAYNTKFEKFTMAAPQYRTLAPYAK